MCEDSPSCYSLAQLLQQEVQKLLPVFQESVHCEDVSRFAVIVPISELFLLSQLFYRAYCLCRIFTEMAETFLNHMVYQSNVGLGGLYMLDLLLECVAHPDYEVCCLVIAFSQQFLTFYVDCRHYFQCLVSAK